MIKLEDVPYLKIGTSSQVSPNDCGLEFTNVQPISREEPNSRQRSYFT